MKTRGRKESSTFVMKNKMQKMKSRRFIYREDMETKCNH